MAKSERKAVADSARTTNSDEPVDAVRSLIDSVFTRLEGLAANGGLGTASIDLDISAGPDAERRCRVALKVAGGATGATMAAAAGGADTGAQPEFNAEGHHVIALIAEQDLTDNSAETMKAVNAILEAVDRTLLEAATFPDDIRNTQPKTKPFHFVDIPFERGGPANPELPDEPHVLSKIKDFSGVLRNGRASPQERADALSWLIHLFGDVHQPLHCIDHISDLHPGGDRGGNSFRIKGAKKNLHSLWDSCVNVSQDLDDAAIADEILQAHPRSSLQSELAVVEPEAWARASFKLAEDHAYSLEENPDNPPQPSTAYKNNMEKIGRKQAALAAYRLAERLESILSK